MATVTGSYGVMAAYTTRQAWSGSLPPGVLAFSAEEAVRLGQACAFVLDLHRLAYVPLTAT